MTTWFLHSKMLSACVTANLAAGHYTLAVVDKQNTKTSAHIFIEKKNISNYCYTCDQLKLLQYLL